MEYEFIHDSFTGSASARFSMEHEIMGPWLEVEVGKNIEKISILLDAIANVKDRKQSDITIIGMEYTLIFSEDSVKIIANSQFEHFDKDNGAEFEEDLNTDYDSSAECGIEDFKAFLDNWSNFIK
ncbi:YacL family protein [Colwellia sp. RE-S-Sl-9]